MRRWITHLGLIAVLGLPMAEPVSHAQTGWKLAWSDEFDGVRGAAPDLAKWKLEAGAGSAIGGNEEAETYCDPTAKTSQPPCNPNQPNVYLDGAGHLVIVAVRTDQTVTVGAKKVVAPVYTSARMHTVTGFRYGRVEASIRLPAAGDGIWPAFWALGQATPAVKWPATGEIDVIEQWNPLPDSGGKIDGQIIHGAVHGPKAPGLVDGYIDRTADYTLSTPPSAGLHQYAVEWGPGRVDFFVDGNLYERQSLGTMTGKEVWEQDRQPFTILLNLAMGGGFFGYPSQSTSATPTMVVDYVRVYQRDDHVLPRDWGNYDVGGPAVAGRSDFHNGVYSVAGGGVGIVGRFDQFQFAYRSLGGDGEVTAHVLDQTSKLAQAKAGVMLRAGRGAASLFAMTFVSPDNSVHFRYRAAKSDVPSDIVYKGQGNWVKVGRVGDVFTGYASADGKSWTAIGNAKLAIPHDTAAGLVSTARDNKAPNLVRFDHVDVTRTDAGYDGVAVSLPGVLQAEDYDTGGMGYSFSNEFNETGPEVKQIQPPSSSEEAASGYYLAGVKANRYINYSVFVEKDGEYVVTARVANAGAGGALHFNVDQKPLSKPQPVPDTGGTSQWMEMKGGSAHLAAGHHILALVTDSAGSSGVAANVDLIKVLMQ